MLELVTVVTRHRAELRTLVRDYDTARIQLETALARFLEERQEVAGELADAHFALKSQATAEDYEQVEKLIKMMDKPVLVVGSGQGFNAE